VVQFKFRTVLVITRAHRVSPRFERAPRRTPDPTSVHHNSQSVAASRREWKIASLPIASAGVLQLLRNSPSLLLGIDEVVEW